MLIIQIVIGVETLSFDVQAEVKLTFCNGGGPFAPALIAADATRINNTVVAIMEDFDRPI